MKIAYIVLAHKHPEQLLRMINALHSPNSAFFIHVDKLCSILPFERALAKAKSVDIKFIAKREDSAWGSCGFVRAEINGIIGAMDVGGFDFLCILSGQDYPIKSANYISDFFATNAEKSFLLFFEYPFKYLGGNGGLWRLEHYHLQQIRHETIRKSLNRCLRYLSPLLPRRKFPAYLQKPYGGETWMTFNYKAAAYILSFVRSHPDYLDFHRYSLSPDEMFFQTILLNSNKSEILSNIVNEKLHYVDWKTRKENSTHPAILTEGHFDALSRSNKLFARKFDIRIDERILDKIDEHILKR